MSMRSWLLTVSTAMALGGAPALVAEVAGERGVEVIGTDPLAAGARGGLRVGDVIEQVQVVGARGAAGDRQAVATPLEVRAAEFARAGPQDLRLQVLRGGARLQLDLPAGTLGARLRPRLPAPLAEELVAALDEAGDEPLRTLRDRLLAMEHRRAATWVQYEIARRRARNSDVPGALQASLHAIELAAEASVALPVAETIRLDVAADLAHASELVEAEHQLQSMLAPLEAAWPRSRLYTETLHELGRARLYLGKTEAAQAHFAAAIEVSDAMADEFGRASGIYLQGQAHLWRNDNAAGLVNLTQALKIFRRIEPGGREEILCLLRLALAHRQADVLDHARTYAEAALEKIERRDPQTGLDHALFELGVIASRQHHVREAEAFHQRALAHLDQHHPQSQGRAYILNSLGYLKTLRRDYAGAQRHYEQALASFEALELRPDIGLALQNLADNAVQQGNLAGADNYAHRALEVLQSLQSADTALTPLWNIQARVALDSGRLEQAGTLYRKALQSEQRAAPDSLRVWGSHIGLARLALQQQHSAAAGEHLEPALKIARRRAPDSRFVALTEFELGRVAEAQGRIETASRRYFAAIDALESAQGLLGGSLAEQAGFLAGDARLYRRLIRVLTEQGRHAEAFEVLERYRSRLLLDINASAGAALPLDLPTALAGRVAALQQQHDRVSGRLLELPDADDARTGPLLLQIDGLRRDMAELYRQVQADADPQRLASMGMSPRPDIAAIRAALQPGTLLLSYAVMQERSYLFSLSHRELRVLELPHGRAALEPRIAALRALIALTRPNAVLQQALHDNAHRLFQDLLAPVAGELAQAQRLVIVADGPLHALPFAALVSAPAAPTRARPEYLIERLPISLALSAAAHVAAGDGDAHRPRGADELVVFARAQGVAVPSAVADTRDGRRPALPYVRQEALAIAGLYGDRAQVFLDAQASESRAKQAGGKARILHFATHAVLQEALPLDSYLLLGAGDGDNGLLQAWEVAQQMHLDADLVTLAGCDTVMGKDYAGVGQLGLHSAFMVAGARAVLGTLWGVPDRQASDLMQLFYRHLVDGDAPDLALQRAQRALLDGRVPTGSNGLDRLLRAWESLFDRSGGVNAESSHWAAFQLTAAGR